MAATVGHASSSLLKNTAGLDWAEFRPIFIQTKRPKSGIFIHGQMVGIGEGRTPVVTCETTEEAMEEEEEEEEKELNWSERVEDLVAGGDTDAAITFLEFVISKLEATSGDTDPRLISALSDLAKLYSTIGFSLKADAIQAKALLLKQRLLESPSSDAKTIREDQSRQNDSINCESSSYGSSAQSKKLLGEVVPADGSSDEDWEAIADRSPNELLSPQSISGVSELPPTETKVENIKRRGRGTFSYKKNELYSDQVSSDYTTINDKEIEDVSNKLERNLDLRNSKYGTRHVLVLADFPPSTKTMDLEKLLEEYKGSGFVIRWVNDTLALAVFRTPSNALEASKCITCPFKVRILEDDDTLLSSIAPKDLEPPRERPKTSARTAQRMIAQGMGLKLPSPAFGSRELRKQEDDRRNRIIARQKLKDDAWGDE